MTFDLDEFIKLRDYISKLIREMELEKMCQQWVRQGQELKNEYPGFDLLTESRENEEFVTLLGQGKSVREAYEKTHNIDGRTKQ